MSPTMLETIDQTRRRAGPRRQNREIRTLLNYRVSHLYTFQRYANHFYCEVIHAIECVWFWG